MPTRTFGAIISFSAKNKCMLITSLSAGQDGTIPAARVTTDETVAICVLGRNENSYIKEWADHHFALGIDKIYLYDHNSDTPMDTEIPAYVKSGQVVSTFFKTYDFVPSAWDNYTHGKTAYYISAQLWAYRDCLERHGSEHVWLAFIDIDEFVIMLDPQYKYDLPGFMKKYKRYAALGVQWRVMGSSGNELPPKEGPRLGYTHCLPRSNEFSRTVKMILQPKYTQDVIVSVYITPLMIQFFCSEEEK